MNHTATQDREMTKMEGAVISAHTGFLCCQFSDMHRYVEKILGRPFFTHEFGSKKWSDIIKEKSKDDFLVIINSLTE